jgi:hypothetical protein
LLERGAVVELPGIAAQLRENRGNIGARVGGRPVELRGDFTEREREVLRVGGLINWFRDRATSAGRREGR